MAGYNVKLPGTIPANVADALRDFVGADEVNFITEYTPSTDGTTDVAALLEEAAADCIAADKTLVIQNRGFAYMLGTTWNVPANLRVSLRGSPLFKTTLTGACLSIEGDDVEIDGHFRLLGTHNSNLYAIQIQTGSDRFKCDEITIENGNSGVVFFGADAEVNRITLREMRGTGVKCSGSASVGNRVGRLRVRNAASFGVYGESNASGNFVGSIEKYVDAAKFTAWQIANRPENADGRMGLEALGLTKGCDEWMIGPVIVKKSGDAGISLSGDYNVVASVQASDCALNGISFIGNFNRVLGGWAKRCENGASFTPNAGGISKKNLLANFRAVDNRTYGIQNNDASNYRTWASGAVGTATQYCKYGLNVYKTTDGSSPTTYGTIAPVHTSGSVSDGLVNWTWVNGDTVTLDANDNVVLGVSSLGNAVADWNQQGTGKCLSIAHPPGTLNMGVAISHIPSTTGNAAGTNRGVGAVDLQEERALASQTASGANAVVSGGKNNRASQANSTVSGGSNNVASGTGAYVAGGDSNTADATYTSIPGGRNATARGTSGARAHANGRFDTTDGSRQSRWLPVSVRTTNATQTKLTTDSGTASTSNRLIAPANSAVRFRGEIVAYDATGEVAATWDVSGLVRRGASVGSVVLVGSTITKVWNDAGAASWALALAVDTSVGGLDVLVTGAASTTIDWFGELTCREVQ